MVKHNWLEICAPFENWQEIRVPQFEQGVTFVNKQTSYKDALRDILLRGGDTDTNAAIVGGLLGAADGIDGINKD